MHATSEFFETHRSDGARLDAWLIPDYWYPDKYVLEITIRYPGAPASMPYHDSRHKSRGAAIRQMNRLASGWLSMSEITANMEAAEKGRSCAE